MNQKKRNRQRNRQYLIHIILYCWQYHTIALRFPTCFVDNCLQYKWRNITCYLQKTMHYTIDKWKAYRLCFHKYGDINFYLIANKQMSMDKAFVEFQLKFCILFFENSCFCSLCKSTAMLTKWLEFCMNFACMIKWLEFYKMLFDKTMILRVIEHILLVY